MTKKIDLTNTTGDTITAVLMDTGYAFNKDTHATWADVSTDELSNGNGYTTGGQTVTVASITEDDSNDYASAVITDFSWTASGGSIGPTPGVLIYDNTTSDDTVIGFIAFGSELTITDGSDLLIDNAEIRVT
jgi:hypothetical protein